MLKKLKGDKNQKEKKKKKTLISIATKAKTRKEMWVRETNPRVNTKS